MKLNKWNNPIDKFLSGYMGECYHQWPEPPFISRMDKCVKCGSFYEGIIRQPSQNFDTWNGFGRLIIHLTESNKLLATKILTKSLPMNSTFPQRFSYLTYRYLRRLYEKDKNTTQ